jgi:hypothetical protein
LLAHPRIAPVGADDEIGVDLEGWTPAAHADTSDAAGALQQLGHLRVHQEREPRPAGGLLGDEVEKVPLGHERHEPAVRGQVTEVGDAYRLAAHVGGDGARLLVRAAEQRLQHVELVHHVERRGMLGVATKVPQEVAVLLQYHHVDTRGCQQ